MAEDEEESTATDVNGIMGCVCREHGQGRGERAGVEEVELALRRRRSKISLVYHRWRVRQTPTQCYDVSNSKIIRHLRGAKFRGTRNFLIVSRISMREGDL